VNVPATCRTENWTGGGEKSQRGNKADAVYIAHLTSLVMGEFLIATAWELLLLEARCSCKIVCKHTDCFCFSQQGASNGEEGRSVYHLVFFSSFD
jgi:hypothetical protein